MNQTGCYGEGGGAVLMGTVLRAGVTEKVTAGVKTTWAGAPEDAIHQDELARMVEQCSVSNERLLAYAARNPPPQSWYDQDEELF
jgi:hypothetical protein